MSFQTNAFEQEKHRIKTEYRRRETEIETDLYAPWQPAESFIVSERKTMAAAMLHNSGKFPEAGDECLEIGYGRLGWLAEMISWGLRETDLHGIELDENRARQAQMALPSADLRIGDATKLPWNDKSFKFVIASTVFSSILDLEMKHLIAEEIKRVLVNKGVLIWYDLAVNNPKNPNVKGISGKDLRNLFPDFDSKIKSVTLAPPIARLIAPRSLTMANFLSSFPFLRTHLLSVMVKK